jgi:HlyD family secretion protein
VDQDVNFTVDAYPYRTFHGKVKQIRYGAVTNQNVVNYDCVVAVQNEDSKLLPGMTANLSIVIAAVTNCVKIPNMALRFRPPEPAAAALTNAPNTNKTDSARTNGPIEATGRGDLAQRGGGGGDRGNGAGGEGFRKGPGAGGGSGFRGGGGGGGGGRDGSGGPGGGPPKPRPERAGPRTVYTLAQGNGKTELKPLRIRTGITDGVNTEVLEGLKEGDQVVIGLLSTQSSGPGGPGGNRPSNPFGGGGFRRF